MAYLETFKNLCGILQHNLHNSCINLYKIKTEIYGSDSGEHVDNGLLSSDTM